MGYYMRFISTDEKEITIKAMAEALTAEDSSYELQVEQDAECPSGILLFRGEEYAEIESNTLGDEVFEEEIEELKEFLEDAGSGDVARVHSTLEDAKGIVAARVLFGGRKPEETLLRLSALWTWLLNNRTGLLQADGQGYFDASGLMLEVE